jgi:LacI family transcriptional regulator
VGVLTRRSRAESSGDAVTLQDVAQAAGVSLATASRTLHDGTRAPRAPLQERVRAAATALGYSSHGPAQALATSTTPVVGLIVHDIADPYFSALAIGAMRVAHDNGLLVLIGNTFRDPALELNYLRRLKAQRARGVLLLASGFAEHTYQAELRQELTSFEALDGRVACVSPHGFAADSVLPDHRAGARQVADHLVGLGHERIGVVTGPANLLTSRERLYGLRQRLRALGRPLPAARVARSDFTRDGGRRATRELMARCPDLTAVFALNDLMAVGVLNALRDDLGRSVPGEVSVVGYDDIPLTEDLQPPLTTVHLPLGEIGAHGMRLLLGERPPGVRTIRVPARLVPRASSGPAPESGLTPKRSRRGRARSEQ